MTVRNVKKNLAGQQDLLPGVGPYNQIRRGVAISVDGPAKSYIELWKSYCGDAYVGTFEDGFTATTGSVAVSLTLGKAYKYTGATQVTVAKDSSPGIGWSELVISTDSLLVREALRRSYADAGYTLVAGSFEAGGILVNANDVLLYEATSVAYSYSGTLPHAIAAGETPVGNPLWVMKSDSYYIVTAEQFGAVGDGIVDDSLAFQAAGNFVPENGSILLGAGKAYLVQSITFNKAVSLYSTGRAIIKTAQGLSWIISSGSLPIIIENISFLPTLIPNQSAPTQAINIEVTNKNFGAAGMAIVRRCRIEKGGAGEAFYNGIVSKNQPVYVQDTEIVLKSSHNNPSAQDGSQANWVVNSGAGILLNSASYSATNNVKIYYASDAIRGVGQIEEVHISDTLGLNTRRAFVFEGLTGSANEHRIENSHAVVYYSGIEIGADDTKIRSLCSIINTSILAALDTTVPQLVYAKGCFDGANIDNFQAYNNGTRGTNDIAVWLPLSCRRTFIKGLYARGVGKAVYVDNTERNYIDSVSVLQTNMTGPAPVVYAYGPNANAPVNLAWGFPEQDNVFPATLVSTNVKGTNSIGLKTAPTVVAGVVTAGADRLTITEVTGTFRFNSADAGGVLQYNAGIDQGGSFRSKGVYPLSSNTYTIGTPSLVWSGGFTQTAFTVTSDERVKVNIASILNSTNEAEMAEFKAMISAWREVDFFTYQFIDRVEKKGQAGARWHLGIIAQRAIASFTKRGLDWTKYAIFNYDKWEAKPAIYDDDGVVIHEAIEAGDKYTINYEEALILESVSQRDRYDSIEARLSALEAR